ncbi:tetratricopeptide repeat protein [Sulfurimonas sp. SAG-AH-194-C20]|nr:tetratricopeptide repeat protein [Sulfurimonas sp. SAG-AH-194-C20]MDF1879422.1 tetratricopeptide repeat protein [Sulfurimonas sp. SAG-AH-194-C20]
MKNLTAVDYNNQAITAYNSHQYKDSEVAFKKAIELDPNYAEAYANLGALYAKFKEYDKAIKLYQQCIKIKPSYAGAYTNLGNALNKTKRHEEAVYFHKTAISLDDTSANHFSNCASAYKNLGRFDKAKSYYKKALSLDPNHVNAHFDLATVLLQTGENVAGWSEYEWRFKKEEMSGHLHKYKSIFEAPLYAGEELNGERVLVHAEQGFGDVLMMARYLGVLKLRGATVVLYLRVGLKELFAEMECVDEVYTRDEKLPVFDLQLAFMSLAFVFDKELTGLTNNYPYIKTEEKFELTSTNDKKKIGIVWGASSTGESYKDKVFSLKHFTLMAKHRDLQLYSLQVGDDDKDIANYDLQDDIIDLSKHITSFKTTAQMINSLDLVITSDTSVAHLCGAMGKKVWIVLQKVPDWRWGVCESYSSWYPSARLFPQYSLGDFNSAFRQVYKALENEYSIKVIDE